VEAVTQNWYLDTGGGFTLNRYLDTLKVAVINVEVTLLRDLEHRWRLLP